MTRPFSRSGDNIATAKDQLRQSMRRLRAAIAPEQSQRAAAAAAAHIGALPELSGARVVACYSRIDAEIDPSDAARALLARGVVLVYPRVIPRRATLAFHRVERLEDLLPGHLSIPEPSAQLPEIPPTSISALIVPGLAFSSAGARLGWGRGYYDATLAQCPHALRVGVAFQCQLTAHLPTHERDIPMHILVTDEQVYRFDKAHGPAPTAGAQPGD